MSMTPVLDTHVWIWWMLGDPGLDQAERDALDALPPENRPVLCDISLWEFATLVDLGRIEIEGTVEDWLCIAASPATVRMPLRIRNVGARAFCALLDDGHAVRRVASRKTGDRMSPVRQPTECRRSVGFLRSLPISRNIMIRIESLTALGYSAHAVDHS
jgi:PIN domain nuclease of toxin-antitoxin system